MTKIPLLKVTLMSIDKNIFKIDVTSKYTNFSTNTQMHTNISKSSILQRHATMNLKKKPSKLNKKYNTC